MPANIRRNPVSEDLWLWIHHRIRAKGFTWVRLAQKYGCKPATIQCAKYYAYPRIEKILADILGVDPQDIFPNRYTADGKPIGRNYPRGQRLTERKIICNGKFKQKTKMKKIPRRGR